MDPIDERLKLAKSLSACVRRLDAAAAACDALDWWQLGLQLIDLESQLLNLHSDVVKLDGKLPQLRPLQNPPDELVQQLPF